MLKITKLFLLKLKLPQPRGNSFAFVVAAHTEKEARELAAKSDKHKIWENLTHTTCELIGTSSKNANSTVILREPKCFDSGRPFE